jgi:hypothetical protein
MPNKWQLTALVAVAVLGAWLDYIFVLHSPEFTAVIAWRLVSTSVTWTGAILYLFNIYFWRWFRRLPIAPKPLMAGTWRVKGSPWGVGSAPLDPFEGFMFVKQHYFSLSMRLETEETISEIVIYDFDKSRGGVDKFWAIYSCEARGSKNPNKLTSHYGGFYLEYKEAGGSSTMDGHFWVDREIRDAKGNAVFGGELSLSERISQNLKHYDFAVEHYNHLAQNAVAGTQLS